MWLMYDGMEHAPADDGQHTCSGVLDIYVEHMPGTILVREERTRPNNIGELKKDFTCLFKFRLVF